MSPRLRVEMIYYTYAYLREDGTPYYIGKGKGNRVYNRGKYDIKPPKDKKRVIFLKQNLTEDESFKHEVYMIAVFGRKDLGTGILHNKTNGGDGLSNPNEETRRKMSESHKGEKSYMYGKILSPERREKISESKKGKNNPNYGKPRTQETRAKISAAQKGEKNHNYGKITAPEIRAKIGAANKGKNSGKKRPDLVEKNKQNKGKIWITNGIVIKSISKTDIIPEGFVKGRILPK